MRKIDQRDNCPSTYEERLVTERYIKKEGNIFYLDRDESWTIDITKIDPINIRTCQLWCAEGGENIFEHYLLSPSREVFYINNEKTGETDFIVSCYHDILRIEQSTEDGFIDHEIPGNFYRKFATLPSLRDFIEKAMLLI